MRLGLGVAAMGAESPEGTFIRTGAELKRLRSVTDLTGEGKGLLLWVSSLFGLSWIGWLSMLFGLAELAGSLWVQTGRRG